MDVPWDGQFEEALRTVLPWLDGAVPITPDLNLVDAGLDSLGTVELLNLLERRYRIVIPEEDLDLGSFTTPALVWRLVGRSLPVDR